MKLKKDMKIAYIRNQSQGVNYHRLEVPMSLLAHEGMNVTELDIVRHDADFDVVIFNRLPSQFQPLSTLERLKNRGVKIIFDIDDYWTRPFWLQNDGKVYEHEYTLEIIKGLRLANHIWVSTPYLQEQIAGLMLESTLIPNAINYEEPQFTNQRPERSEAVVGWIGGVNHHMDFKMIETAFHKGIQGEVMIGGLRQVDQYWKYLGQVLKGGRHDKIKYYQGLDVYNYAVLYNEMDIMLLPSFGDKFTRCKSNLKLLEAGAFKIPVISNGVIYKEVNNKIGFRVNSDKEWNKAVEKLKKSRRMRNEIGEALFDYTSTKYDIRKINETRKQIIEL